MRRGIDPKAKAILRRWFPDSILERAILVFGDQTVLLANLTVWLAHRFKVQPGAVTLGERINIYLEDFEDTSATELALLAHELAHVEQWERSGGLLIFGAKYLLHLALGFLKYGRRYLGPIQYRTHPFERPAIERQIEVLEALGARREAKRLRRWLEKD